MSETVQIVYFLYVAATRWNKLLPEAFELTLMPFELSKFVKLVLPDPLPRHVRQPKKQMKMNVRLEVFAEGDEKDSTRRHGGPLRTEVECINTLCPFAERPFGTEKGSWAINIQC